MAAQEFDCPNCGAPLDYDGTSVTMRCSYCDTSVVVPADLRPKHQAEVIKPEQPFSITLNPMQLGSITKERRSSYLLWGILGCALLLVLALVIIPSLLGSQAKKTEVNVIEELAMPLATQYPVPTQVPEEPTAMPSPGFALLVNTFGSSGIGPGYLNQAKYLAVDGTGTLYVADYRDGRVQAFDFEGKYLHGWQVGDGKTSIYGMTSTYGGLLYVSYGGDIYRYEGSSGKAQGKLDYENGKEFGDLAALPGGGVLGVWYEGRWGLITSLEGHRDDLVWFNAEGKTDRTLESFISGQTDDTALDTVLAVDGLGTIYALDKYDGTVYKFTALGKYVDRFGFTGSDPNQYYQFECITVDEKGRVYLGGGQQVTIFSADGRYISSFGTDSRVVDMAFNAQGDLYTLSWDAVAHYTLGELP